MTSPIKMAWEKYQLGRPRGDISREPAFNSGWEAALNSVDKAVSDWIDSGNRVGDLNDALLQLRRQRAR
jgi:hypothetical protein